jgi:CDP-diacylglycerol--glycerol-3-phosphate 3-phosphatidyltransferase
MWIILVNAITLLRVILSGAFAYYIFQPHGRMLVFTVLFMLICATDLLDGFLARKLSACSRNGAFFDVAADFIFILFSVIALATTCTFPVWMAAVIVMKFIEFCYTSVQFNKISGTGRTTLLFDPLGKATAISFFLLPYLFVLLQYYLPLVGAVQVYTAICLIVTLAALISSAGRVRFLLHSRLTVAK